jgi:hypothetical protein
MLDMPNGEVSKASWGNFHPAPPMRGGGIRKFPSRELKIRSEPFPGYPDVTSHIANNRRGKHVGYLQLNKQTINMAHVEPGFRRRGVAAHLLRHAEKKGPVYHDTNRTSAGNAWAHKMDAKRGTKPPPTGLESEIKSYGMSRKKTAMKLRNQANYDSNRRNVVTVAASSSRTGAATKGPLQGNSSRALGQRRKVKKSRGEDMDFLEMPGVFPEKDVRAELLTQLRTRDVKTGRFVGAPTLVAKNIGPALESASWAVPVGWLGIDRRKRKKQQKVKMDPKLSVTLKKKPKE